MCIYTGLIPDPVPVRMRLHLPLVLVALALPPLTAVAESVRVAGTASGMALLQKLDSLLPDTHPRRQSASVPLMLGSNGSLRALAAGRIDLAIVSRQPQADEGTLKVITFAATPLVLASNTRVAPQNLSPGEIVEFFAGRRRQWPNGETVRLVLRAPFEGDVTVLRELHPDMGPVIDNSVRNKVGPVGENDVDAVELLSRLPGSFGSTTLGLMRVLDVRLTTHAIDGVTPSPAVLANGRYPLAKQVYLVTRPNPDAATTGYVAFLQSKPVRDLLRHLDYVPANE